MRNWKVSRMPGFNEWKDEMIKITSYEYMLDRVNGESKMKDTWDSLWVYMNIKWKVKWVPTYLVFLFFILFFRLTILCFVLVRCCVLLHVVNTFYM